VIVSSKSALNRISPDVSGKIFTRHVDMHRCNDRPSQTTPGNIHAAGQFGNVSIIRHYRHVSRGRPLFRIRFRFRRRMWTNGHFRRTFGFGRKQSYHIRCTFGFGVLQLVNSVVAESRLQSLSCGGRECARSRESLASLCTD